MKPEDKVCTLEQSKRLVELEIVFETEKYWWGEKLYTMEEVICWANNWNNGNRNDCQFPSPDVAELGKVLPIEVEIEGHACYLHTWPIIGEPGEWALTYECGSGQVKYSVGCMPEAQTRASALIWLLENSHIKSSDIN